MRRYWPYPKKEFPLDITQEVLRVLDDVLSLKGRSATFTPDTPLLGAIPELDSMAVVTPVSYTHLTLPTSDLV